MPPLADPSTPAPDTSGRWPLPYLVVDALIAIGLVGFWSWITLGLWAQWGLAGVVKAFGLLGCGVALLAWLDARSTTRLYSPTPVSPATIRRLGTLRGDDGPSASPVAGGRRVPDEAGPPRLFSLRVPAGMTSTEFARRLGLVHSRACACGGRFDSQCLWEVLPEIERQNGPARVLAAGFERYVGQAVGRHS